MTADALLFIACCRAFFLFVFLNKYAESLGDQPVGQLCSSVTRTLAAEKSALLLDSSFQLSVLIH